MKKTISANLANRNFIIEEDAYNMLDDYIRSIRNHYRSMDPDGEVAQDFETRLSELFDEKMRLGYNVISVSVAHEVIKQLGKVDDLMDEDVPGMEGGAPKEGSDSACHQAENDGGRLYSSAAYAGEEKKTTRKLFREPRGKWLGGVLSGLAEYVDTDPILLRLIFIILIFTPIHFIAIVLYIAGWIFLPQATNAADRLAMEGKEVTSENLWTKISEDSQASSAVNTSVDQEIDGNIPKKNSKNWIWWLVAILVLIGAIASLVGVIHAIANGFGIFGFDFFPFDFLSRMPVVAAILIAVIAVGLGLIIAGLLVYIVAILPIGLVMKSQKLTTPTKVIIIIIWLVLLTIWFW